MTLNYQERDADGNPKPMPLLHGADTNLDIQLTVTWVCCLIGPLYESVCVYVSLSTSPSPFVRSATQPKTVTHHPHAS